MQFEMNYLSLLLLYSGWRLPPRWSRLCIHWQEQALLADAIWQNFVH